MTMSTTMTKAPNKISTILLIGVRNVTRLRREVKRDAKVLGVKVFDLLLVPGLSLRKTSKEGVCGVSGRRKREGGFHRTYSMQKTHDEEEKTEKCHLDEQSQIDRFLSVHRYLLTITKDSSTTNSRGGSLTATQALDFPFPRRLF